MGAPSTVTCLDRDLHAQDAKELQRVSRAKDQLGSQIASLRCVCYPWQAYSLSTSHTKYHMPLIEAQIPHGQDMMRFVHGAGHS